MRTYVQTRGVTADYAFLGAAPSTRWWRAFRDATSFEQPTAIVSGERGEWRCYVSGIPSGRTDRVGTAIRYTVIIEGRCGEPADDALKLVSSWLSDATNGEPGRRVQDALDAVFDEATVEGLLAVRGADRQSDSEVERLAAGALANLPASRQPASSSVDGSWVGSTTSTLAQGELLARIAEILRGELDGTAALLNLLGTVDEVTRLAAQIGPLGALIEDPAGALGDAVVSVEKKKLPAASPSRHRSTIRRVAIGILIGAISLALWWLLRRPPPPPPEGHRELAAVPSERHTAGTALSTRPPSPLVDSG